MPASTYSKEGTHAQPQAALVATNGGMLARHRLEAAHGARNREALGTAQSC